MKYILAAVLALTSTAVTAQTVQFSDVEQSVQTGDRSGFSFLFDYTTGLRGEVLICEGGCKRFALSDLNVTDRGFTANVLTPYNIIRYRGTVDANGHRMSVTDNQNLNMIFNLYRCNKSAPARIRCYNHNNFKLKTQAMR